MQTPAIIRKEPLNTADAKWVSLKKIVYTDQLGKERVVLILSLCI